MVLPVIICDDDMLLMSHYKAIVENWIMINDYDMKVVLATTDPDDISLYLDKYKLSNSLFFLDIDLGSKLDGITVAEGIRAQNEFAQIVFITSHQELALETIKRQIAPLDYIVKDGKTEKDQIQKILDGRHIQTFIDQKSSNRHFSFMIGSRHFKIDVSSIYFLETSVIPHKINLYGEKMMYEFYGKMSNFEQKYPELLRVHKSFMINLENVQSIDFKARTIYFPEEYTCTFPLAKSKLLKKMIEHK